LLLLHGLFPDLLFTIPHAECKITAGHWPISSHFSKMAIQNFSMVHSLCTHVPIKFNFKFLILHSARVHV